MSSYKGFRTGSGSNGQFWFGGSSFPGFLYKKNVGVGARRSTQFTPGGTTICNHPTDLYNKYKPGGGGVGASSMSNRRAKNRLATVCGSTNKCFPCYNTLGQYSNYTHNPNGFVPCPSISVSVTPTPSGPYTVTYLGNGSNGGSVPVDGSSPYTAGSTVSVLGNTFTRTGYIFAGWSTNSSGTGSDYNGGDLFTINANTTLYAQWIPVPPSGTYTLTYDGNRGIGSEPAPTTEYSGGIGVTVLGNIGIPPLARTGRTFGGWNTAAGGTGTYYPEGSILTMPYANTILYAQWYTTSGSPTLSVTYNGNGSTGGTVPATVNYKSGQGVGITGNTGSLINGSLTFYGWNTAANGLGTAYPVTSNGFTMPTANVTLYAQWVNTSVNYTLTYFGNGSDSGTVPPATPYPSGAATSVSSPTIAKSGFTFLGWNTAANGSGINYSNNASIVMTENKSLYAQWVGGVLVKSCPEGFNIQLISMGSTISDLYRDNTNNTMTIILQVKYSVGSPAAPYGTGNGPVDTGHLGSNMLNTYSRVELSQVAGVYTFNISYQTNWRNSTTGAIQTETQTGTLSLGSGSGSYWPTGQTIQDITIIPSGFASFPFSCLPSPVAPPAPTPIPQTSLTVSGFGCNSDSQGIPSYVTISQIMAFYINFNTNTTTRVAIAIQNQWQGTANPFTLNYNRTRIELANGLTPVPISGTFTPTATTSVISTV